jgi:hypothetical protein
LPVSCTSDTINRKLTIKDGILCRIK